MGSLYVLYQIFPPIIRLLDAIFSLSVDARRNRYLRQQEQRELRIKKELADGVRPVLYLRPFVLDGTKFVESEYQMEEISVRGVTFGKDLPALNIPSVSHNAELGLFQLAEQIGPFIAIGEPHDSDLNLGAYRIYYSNQGWQKEALQIMTHAAMILVRIDGVPSNGFGWEIGHIQKSFLDKTVFFVEIADRKVYKGFAEELKKFNLNFPSELPPVDAFEGEQGFFASFDGNGKCRYVHSMKIDKVFKHCKKLAKERQKGRSVHTLKNPITIN